HNAATALDSSCAIGGPVGPGGNNLPGWPSDRVLLAVLTAGRADLPGSARSLCFRGKTGGTGLQRRRPMERGGIRRVLTGAIAAAIVVLPCVAESIPAWLDDGISNWNRQHPESRIEFVNIRDSFVWYQMPKTEVDHT